MEAGVETPAVDCSRYAQSDAPPVFHAMDPNVASILPTARIAVPAGVSIPISVGNFDPPYTIRPIPLPCMDWQVRPDDAARITQDGSVIEIPEAARPGSEILLTGTIRGAEGEAGSQTLRILIIDEITRQLIGTWSFDAVRGCDATQVDAPLEIRFEANNGLSVTWTPFERYWDYWGVMNGRPTVAISVSRRPVAIRSRLISARTASLCWKATGTLPCRVSISGRAKAARLHRAFRQTRPVARWSSDVRGQDRNELCQADRSWSCRPIFHPGRISPAVSSSFAA